jgi:ATP-binding cassette, subfamily B (MDR/TAP), member 8
MTAGTRVFEYLAVEPKVDLIAGSIISDEQLKGEIRFEGISFHLKDFNLTLKQGQTVALVGSSGSGKSTVAALLERFHEPSSGTIYIDGVDLSEISPIWLRNEVIVYIDQQPILFGCSIKKNIKYGRQNATAEEILDASKKSQSHEFIESLPEKYQTNVGEPINCRPSKTRM